MLSVGLGLVGVTGDGTVESEVSRKRPGWMRKSSLSARGGSARSDLSRLAEPQPATMQVAFAATHSVPDIRYEHGCGLLK